VNPDIAAAVDGLRGDGVLGDLPASRFGRVARRELVSMRVEIRAALYLGVLFLTGGIGLFAWGEATSSHAGFDYVLLLGALLVATDLGYLESQFAMLGPNWAWHLLVVAIFYGLLAYRFDSKILLSLSLASFAAWRGIALSVERTSLGTGDPARLRVEALFTGVLFAVLGVSAARAGKKPHFEDVYVNAGLLLAFGGLLSGAFGGREAGWRGWLLALLLVSCAVAFAAFRTKRPLPFALAVLAAWLGLQRMVFEGAGAAPAGALLVSAITAAGALGGVIAAHRKMKIP
jgi:hypothetical protein